MRCHICDKALTDAEVQFIPETKGFECCSICLEAAMDAAYCDGYVRPDDAENPGFGEVEVLEPEWVKPDELTVQFPH